MDEIVDAFPEKLLRPWATTARPTAPREAFSKLAEGLDSAIVRVVAARPGSIDSTRAVMDACKPALVSA